MFTFLKCTVQLCHAIFQCNYGVQFYSVIFHCSYAVPFFSAIMQCNNAVQLCSAIMQCNYAVQLCSAIIQCCYAALFCIVIFEKAYHGQLSLLSWHCAIVPNDIRVQFCHAILYIYKASLGHISLSPKHLQVWCAIFGNNFKLFYPSMPSKNASLFLFIMKHILRDKGSHCTKNAEPNRSSKLHV